MLCATHAVLNALEECGNETNENSFVIGSKTHVSAIENDFEKKKKKEREH